jgi:hypothetical protein
MEILLVVALLAFLVWWAYREHFSNTDTAKKSGYEDILKEMGQTVEYQPVPSSTSSSTPAPATEDVMPAKCPNGMVDKAGLRITGCFDPNEKGVDPPCPSGLTLKNGGCVDPANPSARPVPSQPCPSGLTFDPPTKKCIKYEKPFCDVGYTLYEMVSKHDSVCVKDSVGLYDATGRPPNVTCKTGDSVLAINVNSQGYTYKCLPAKASVSSTPSLPAGSPPPTMSGNTTGGSSTSSMGPTSGGGGDRRSQVFGPVFTSIGSIMGGKSTPDSSSTNRYPELLVGQSGKSSTLVEGAGIVPPSKNWQMANDGTLPSSAQLGSDENSKYLPMSRVPGDQDLIPDPYRVSQSYSTANYAFKTEPVPFLTDFSAFQK